MTETTWFVLLTVAAGLFGRLIKFCPRIPQTALPWMVLLAGYALAFGLGLYHGLGAQAAALGAWQGLAAGIAAIGGHESLKGLLVPVLGMDGARWLLGRLPAKPPGSPAKGLPLAIVLAVALTGCAAMLPYLVAAGQVAQWVAALLDQIEPAKEVYFDARPSPDLELRVDQSIARLRMALSALDEAVLAAQSAHDADVEAAKAHVLRCYEELYALLETSGLLGEIAGLGGRGGTPLPTPDEVAARL
jgi:hypothetical protein